MLDAATSLPVLPPYSLLMSLKESIFSSSSLLNNAPCSKDSKGATASTAALAELINNPSSPSRAGDPTSFATAALAIFKFVVAASPASSMMPAMRFFAASFSPQIIADFAVSNPFPRNVDQDVFPFPSTLASAGLCFFRFTCNSTSNGNVFNATLREVRKPLQNDNSTSTSTASTNRSIDQSINQSIYSRNNP